MELGEGLKKILLAGIGTAAVTAEKSKEILDDLVKKGELTVEQGKVLNQELKHNIKSTVKSAADSVKESAARKNDQEELKATISKLTPEQLAAVKAQIESMQAEAAEKKAAELLRQKRQMQKSRRLRLLLLRRLRKKQEVKIRQNKRSLIKTDQGKSPVELRKMIDRKG